MVDSNCGACAQAHVVRLTPQSSKIFSLPSVETLRATSSQLNCGGLEEFSYIRLREILLREPHIAGIERRSYSHVIVSAW